MIPPFLRTLKRVPGTPKQFRLLLIVYTIRHAIGLAVFAWLLKQAFEVGGTFRIIMGLATLAYAGVVVYGWINLRAKYARSQQFAMNETAQ